MSNEQEFIAAIEKTLSDFEQNEKSLSKQNAIDISHIRGLLDGGEAFIELHALVKDYVEIQMSRKLFGFLPFVVDLKSQLLDVLRMSKFDPIVWLHSTRLKRSRSVGDMPSEYNISLKEINGSDHSGCEARFSKLESEIKKINEINENFKTTNEELVKTVQDFTVYCSKIHAELTEVKNSLQLAKSENEKLNLAILQKDEEIVKKDKEIARLETENKALRGNSQSKRQPDKLVEIRSNSSGSSLFKR